MKWQHHSQLLLIDSLSLSALIVSLGFSAGGRPLGGGGACIGESNFMIFSQMSGRRVFFRGVNRLFKNYC